MPWKMSLLVAVSVLLAAGEAGNGTSSIDPWLRLGEFGCLALFCGYGMMRFVPEMQKASDKRLATLQALFAEENQKSREHSSQIIDKLVERQEKDRVAFREVLQDLIRHCTEQSTRAASTKHKET